MGSTPFDVLVLYVNKFEVEPAPPQRGPFRPQATQSLLLQTVVVEGDARFRVRRFVVQPGGRTDPPGMTHPDRNDVVIVSVTPGRVEISTPGQPDRFLLDTGNEGGFVTADVQPGKWWWFPPPPNTHSIANVGDRPWSFVSLYVSPTRRVSET